MAEPTASVEARWDTPSPYGHPAAIDSMGAVAAPLLAGFAFTAVALILSSPERFRWVNLTLILLVLAAFALIAALQFAFRARLYVVTPSEIEEWWPDADAATREELRRVQRQHRVNYRLWSNSARNADNVGLVFFMAGFTSALVQPGSVDAGRRVAAIIAALCVTGEICWLPFDWTSGRRRRSAAQSDT